MINVSSTSWWGVVLGPSELREVFRAAKDVLAEWVPSHIDVDEIFALYEVLRFLVKARLDFLRVSTITIDDDKKTMFPAPQKDRKLNELIYNLGPRLSWLNVDVDFTLKLLYMSSRASKRTA